MRKCASCGSSNITVINQDNDYSVTIEQYECGFCDHIGEYNKFRRQNSSNWNYDLSKRPFKDMRKTG